MRDEMVEINGQRLHVTDTGGQGAVLLFAHGNQMDNSMWSRVIDLLRDNFRCIAWDMRLHGSTEDDGLPFTYWEAARDALAILDWGVDGVRPGDRAVPNRCTSIAAAWPWHRSN